MGKPRRSIAEIVILKHGSGDGDLAVLDAVNNAETVGRKLAAARAAKGLSLEEVHVGTKVKIAHLAAIELGDQSSLPAVPFAAGFVKSYAQFLGLDARAFSLAYKAEFGAATPLRSPETAAPPTSAAIATVATEAPSPALPARVEPPSIVTLEASPDLVTEKNVATAPTASTRSASASDRYVLYFSVGAAALFVAIIGADALMKKRTAGTAARTQMEDAQEASPSAAASVAELPVVAAPVAPQPVETPAAEIAIDEAPIAAKVAPPKIKPQLAPVADDGASVRVVEIGAPPTIVGETRAATATHDVDPFALPVSSPQSAPEIAEATILAAQLTRPASPKYPERCSARANAVETVGVTIDITVEGRPTNAGVADSSNACFNDAAVETAYRMRFSPRLIDGKPHMEFGKRVTVRFSQ